MKRTVDVLAALLGLLVLAPVFALIACALLVGDRGPIIYRGTRTGRNGAPFQILKFRTMTASAPGGGAITVSADPRVTPIGRVLRATKLDELPQLINILRGEMSLVGPRPEAPQYTVHYSPEQRQVLAVRPGLTGLSQVCFRHEEHLLAGPDPDTYYRTVLMPAKLALDLSYVRRQSLWFDLSLVALTLAALVRPSVVPAAALAPTPLPIEVGAHAPSRASEVYEHEYV